MPSLHQAMAADESGFLQNLVEQFMAAEPVEARCLAQDIILRWTDVMDEDPSSRGPNVDDARKMLAMEKLVGEPFFSLDCNYNQLQYPHVKDKDTLKVWFADWERKVTAFLMLSTHYR